MRRSRGTWGECLCFGLLASPTWTLDYIVYFVLNTIMDKVNDKECSGAFEGTQSFNGMAKFWLAFGDPEFGGRIPPYESSLATVFGFLSHGCHDGISRSRATMTLCFFYERWMDYILDANETLWVQYAHASWILRPYPYTRNGLFGLGNFNTTMVLITLVVTASLFGLCIGPRGPADAQLHLCRGLRLTGPLRWFLMVLAWGCVQGSEDETARLALRQRAAAAVDPFAARWDWTYQFYGLPQPPLRGYYDAEAHRADSPVTWSPTSVRFRAWQNQDPIAILQQLTLAWVDLSDVLQVGGRWRIYEGHASLRQSLVLNEGARHFLVIEQAETRNHPGEVAIFLEIIWNGDGLQDTSITFPWFQPVTSTLHLLQRAGLLDVCTLSHRCDIDVNGVHLQGVAAQLHFGDFVRIEVFPWSPPHSEDESELPAPISAIASPSQSTTTSSSSSEVACSTSDSSEDAIPEEYTQAVHVFRPSNQRGRLTHIHAVIPPDTRSWRTSVYQAWPELRSETWHHWGVHDSIKADYPTQDDVIFRVIIAQIDLAFPTYVVPLVVLHWRDFSFFRAVAVPRFSTTYHILDQFGLIPWCGAQQEHCMIALNGHPWSRILYETVNHGDYIRITPRFLPRQGFDRHLAETFQQDDELHRWQHIDSVGAARLLGDSSQAAALSPGPLPLPRTTSMSDWYWITMSILMWAATFGLLMRICPCEKRAPCRLICIRGRRTKRSCVRCHNPMRLKPIVFTALLLSQHVTTLEGLQLHQASQLRSSWDLSQLSISPELDPGPQPVLVAHPEVHWDSFARLPPPGNTTGCDIFLTDEGRRFLDFLCEFLESKLQSKQEVKVLLLDKALERKQIFLADHLPSDRCTDVDGYGPPFLPVAEVSPAHFAQPEISAQPSIVHLPDQDPSQLHDGMCRFPFNSKDTEDLFVEWDVTPFPDLPPPSDLNTAVNYVLQLPFVHADDDVQLYIYTDGSFDKHTDIATWAFVVFAIEDQQVYVRDWYADFISIDPMDSSWLGVTQVGIRGAEATAIIYAILYAMQSHRAEVVHIFSDALSIVRSTTGHWILQPDDFIGVNLRAVFLAATILRKGLTTDLTHVKSHCGILGNEFADFLAVGIREQRIAPRPVPRAFEYWFQGIDPHIRHVWLVFDLLHRERATPTLIGDVLSWKPPLKTDGCDWLPCKPLHEKATAAKRCDLLIKCVQYNVCTLRKPGATAYMREQLAYYQVHIAAFQESRTPSSEIQDSNFIRLIAPATGGQGGCELWFATHIPLGTHGGERIFFPGRNSLSYMPKLKCFLWS